MSANLSGLLLLLHVMEQQGRAVTVVSRSAWKPNGHRDDDVIVVEDDTWNAWQEHHG